MCAGEIIRGAVSMPLFTRKQLENRIAKASFLLFLLLNYVGCTAYLAFDLESEPSGAKIEIDGKDTGFSTPARVTAPWKRDPGLYSFRLTHGDQFVLTKVGAINGGPPLWSSVFMENPAIIRGTWNLGAGATVQSWDPSVLRDSKLFVYFPRTGFAQLVIRETHNKCFQLDIEIDGEKTDNRINHHFYLAPGAHKLVAGAWRMDLDLPESSTTKLSFGGNDKKLLRLSYHSSNVKEVAIEGTHTESRRTWDEKTYIDRSISPGDGKLTCVIKGADNRKWRAEIETGSPYEHLSNYCHAEVSFGNQ